jgi:hypothetical protein
MCPTLTGRSPRSGRPEGVAGPLPLRLLNDAPCARINQGSTLGLGGLMERVAATGQTPRGCRLWQVGCGWSAQAGVGMDAAEKTSA